MRKGAPPMSVVWKFREMIKDGYSVNDIIKETGFPASVVRNYTKSERGMIKIKGVV